MLRDVHCFLPCSAIARVLFMLFFKQYELTLMSTLNLPFSGTRFA